jgi:alpha-ketoglutarate-dependent taurine dioxygenase
VRECTAYRHLQLSPVAGALGAEVQGVDLARPLAADVVEEIRQALLAHLVIFFLRQQLVRRNCSPSRDGSASPRSIRK